MQETVSIAWCDNGMVDGKFMQGVTDVLLKSGINFESTLRSQGNQIARQREKVINYWYDQNKADWLLWVDSDVVISPEGFLKLWNQKDKDKRPIMTGVYFTTDNPEEPDIYFFALCEKAGVPLWCDTSVTAPHMKRFSFDEHYYNAMTKRR